jgi:hypothetical protein
MLDRFSWFSSWSWEICDGPVPLPSLSRRMRSTRQVRTLGLFESSVVLGPYLLAPSATLNSGDDNGRTFQLVCCYLL